MHIERKLTAIALGLVAVTASIAVAQVAPRSGGSGGSQGTAAAPGPFDALKASSVQQVLGELIAWKQRRAHEKRGGGTGRDYNSLSPSVREARMEVIRACNLYHRATLN